MYVNKEYDSAATLWDKRTFLEMEDFYKKRNQGQLTDTILYNHIKSDFSRHLTQLEKFSIDSFMKVSLESEGGYKFGYVFLTYTETVKMKSKTVKSMLGFISEDDGKTWVIQDWKVKYIVDQVYKKLL